MDARSEQTVMTLANAITLVGLIVEELSGSDISNTLEGSEVSQKAFFQMACTKIVQKFSPELVKGAK